MKATFPVRPQADGTEQKAGLTVGILGGMGPAATLGFWRELTAACPAEREQDHLPLVIVSLPQIPDRTPSILDQGESPVPMMLAGCRMLQRAGVDLVAIPCVSAHHFLDELRQGCALEFLSVFDVVAEAIAAHPAGIGQVGLMGTEGTARGGRFAAALARAGIAVSLPTAGEQALVTRAIYELKMNQPERDSAEILADLRRVAQGLMNRGAGGVVAACSEIPLLLRQEHLDAPYFDSMALLAQKTCQLALPDRQPLANPTPSQ